MGRYLSYHDIRLFDYTRWAEPLREELRENAEHLASEAGLQIEFIRNHKAFRKEARIKQILAERGEHPGLVHIFSAMEPCSSYRPWHDKVTHRTFLKPTSGKCLHYYFYFIDEQFGLCYVRLPTWSPFRLQVYFNGHSWLARQLLQADIPFEMIDNAFVSIADPQKGQELADGLSAQCLHEHLDQWAQRFCPVLRHFRSGYHWSFMQVEYASDVVFFQQAKLKPLYEAIVRTAVHVIKAEHVVTFLGRKLTGAYQGELGNDFSTRIQGTRIRHSMGPTSIKLYDKAALITRVECTTNDVSFFKHHRYVEQRNGEQVFKLAPLRKSITAWPIYANSCRAPTSAITPSWPASIIPMPNTKPSPRWSHRPEPRDILSVASTSFSILTSNSFSPWRVVSGRFPASVPPICVVPISKDFPAGAAPTS
jgi:hypothetical protein